MAAPALRGVGTAVVATTGGTPGLPTGWQPGDLFVLVCETAYQQYVTVPAGWTQCPDSPVDQLASGGGTVAGTLSAFYRIAQSGDTAPTLADPGDHLTAVIIGWSGVDTSTPFDDTAQFVATGSTATVSCPSVTTTVADCRIMAIGAISRDQTTTDAFTWATNAHLTDKGEIYDQGSAQGNGGSLGVYHGARAATGVVAATTATVNAGNNWWPYTLTLAIRPGGGGGGGGGGRSQIVLVG